MLEPAGELRLEHVKLFAHTGTHDGTVFMGTADKVGPAGQHKVSRRACT